MSCYINSNDNRFYAALESSYSAVASITDANRFPAVSLVAHQELELPARRDKTGGRTFVGLPSGFRRRTTWEVNTFLTGWANQTVEPGYGPLIRGALGAAPQTFAGGTLQLQPTPTQVQFTSAHGLAVGQAITCGGEIRFVAAIVDAQTVVMNAAFGKTPVVGAAIGTTITYRPAVDLPSVSIFDFWSPTAAVQRILSGSAVDRMRVSINGDFHLFHFAGGAADLIDSASFAPGQGGLSSYPLEPAITEFTYSLVPGNLGQAWIGTLPSQFFSITAAEVTVDNDVDLRAREFGLAGPQCITAGFRRVAVDLTLFEQTDAATVALYQAARQRSPVSLFLQLGQQPSHLCGVFLPSVVPEVPDFDDAETRLQWRFQNNRAQGTIDDEVFVAFG